MEAHGEAPPEPMSAKSYSGKFQVRIPPERHKALAMQAAEQGISLNRYVTDKLCA
jgi:predicted HicB family RNase H-like nuclease